jgi:type IV pilus assembly protein PilA
MFMKYKEGAYLDSARSDVKNSVTALEAFNAQYSDYPTLPVTCGPGPTQCSLTDSAGNTSANALNISAGDTVTISADSACANGYSISATNSNIGSGPGSSKSPVSYDSCTGVYTGF